MSKDLKIFIFIIDVTFIKTKKSKVYNFKVN